MNTELQLNNQDIDLLNNLFDSLDRLFDKECTAIDTYQLMFATQIALSHEIEIDLSQYLRELRGVLRKGINEDKQREQSLEITNNLRAWLNDMLDNYHHTNNSLT